MTGAADTAGAPVSVLIVDDNPAKRLALKAVLAPLGYDVVEAASGQAALRILLAQDVAVILLDVRMPDMDGFETASLIRQRRRSEMTPIIFITAYASDDIRSTDRYVEGAVDFMFAPVPPEELRAKVSVFANLYDKAERLAAQAREVKASADQLRLLTEAAPIGIFQTDPENRYVYTNPRWSEITGLSAEQAVGRDWHSLMGPQERDAVDRLPEGTDPRTEQCARFEIRRDGRPDRIVQVTSKVIPRAAGGTAGWVGTLADVTAEAGAEAAMSEARDRATEASRQKSDFLANMSHEIRTPMNGVLGMTDLLLGTVLDDQQRDYAQTVRNSGEALLVILNDILDFAKVEAGKMEIDHVEFDLRGLVEDVLDLLAGSAQAKRLELVARLDRTVPDRVVGDPGRVRQILTNLMGNAIKFTPRGDVRILVSSTDGGDGSSAVVRFEVADTGVGVAPDQFENIFQPFVQADSSTSRRYGGTGLGLAISGQLVALMGGDCGVASKLGEGSTFWFTVRLGVGAQGPAADPGTGDADLAGVTALVVADNAGQREVLCQYLSDWGMAPSTAGDGPAALDALRTAAEKGRRFRLVLVDRSLPAVAGVALEQRISDDTALDVRVVLLTDVGRPADTGAASGAWSVSKPVHPAQLKLCLRAALGGQPRATAGTGAPAGTGQPPPTSGPAGPEIGRLLLAEDNAVNRKVAVAMLSQAGYRVDAVPNGAAAVAAVAAHRYDVVLMDCQMPELDGYEATAAIRAAELGTGRRTEIIALTAGARREDRERCLAEGMDSYLAKPVSRDALLSQVARSVRAGRS